MVIVRVIVDSWWISDPEMYVIFVSLLGKRRSFMSLISKEECQMTVRNVYQLYMQIYEREICAKECFCEEDIIGGKYSAYMNCYSLFHRKKKNSRGA